MLASRRVMSTVGHLPRGAQDTNTVCASNLCVSDVCRVWFCVLSGVYEGQGDTCEQRSVPQRNRGRTRSKQKDGQSEMSPLSPLSPAPEDELFSWPGPKTLHLHRTSQGYGFTLRHFIVYPPESAVYSFKDEDNGSRGKQRGRLEPMDTIFVKQVKEGGSAHQAGLCTGDRLVKVNGESIIGKTYSQVIALIQNSDSFLELSVMPKDEDILQLFSRDITALAYSKDAYLMGNEAFSGNVKNIPEPPPMCYSQIEPNTSGMTQSKEPSAPSGSQVVVSQRVVLEESGTGFNHDVGYRVEISDSSPAHCSLHIPCDECVHSKSVELPETVLLESPECNQCSSTPKHGAEEDKHKALNTTFQKIYPSVRPRSQTTPCSSFGRGALLHYMPKRPPECAGLSTHTPIHTASHLDSSLRETLVHYSAKRLLEYSYTPSHPNLTGSRPSTYIPSPVAASTPCSPMHQNIDWRNYTTYKEYIDNKRLYTYGSRTIQERLDSLRAASHASNANTSLELVGNVNGARQTQESLCDKQGHAGSRVPSLRSISQERLEGKERGPRGWHRSVSQDALSSYTKNIYKPRALSCDYLGRQGESTVSLMDRRVFGRPRICTVEEARGCGQSDSLSKVVQTHRTISGYYSLPRVNFKSNGTDSVLSSRMGTLGISSPTRQLPSQTSIPDDSYVAKALASLNTLKDQRFSPVFNHKDQGKTHLEHTASCPDHSKGKTTELGGNSVSTNGSVLEGIEGPEVMVVVKRDKFKKSCPQPFRHPSYIQAVNEEARGIKKITEMSTCWINNDVMQDGYIKKLGGEQKTLGRRKLHDSLDSIPFIDEPSSPSNEPESAHLPSCSIISPVPPKVTSSSVVVLQRQLSHDQDSLRFTILDSDSGAKTERSKSCDEGLDNFREKGSRTLMKNIATVKGLKTSVDRSSEDTSGGSTRNSPTDVFTDATKEGILHFRQLGSDKGKRVGSGIRPWKQMYAVLHGRSLYLYKDRKEGQNQTMQKEEEPLQISIKACLIDISYSDTKRKNVLRLTTSDCEYLFQAEDREDMLAWIRAIQENSNLDEKNTLITSTDLINRKIREYNNLMSPTSSKAEVSMKSSRQSLSIRHTLLGGKGENKTPSPNSPNKDLERRILQKDETSSPKDKGWRNLMRKPFEKKVAPGVTFGVRLDDCPPAHNNRFVPLIVDVCCKLVEERGLEYTGIYRVPGNNAAISSMQEELNRGVGEIDLHEDKWKDLNVISSLLKSFFRKLPEPLFTNEKYSDFIEANRTEDPVERLKLLKRLLHELPDHHYETLKFLSAHLKTVAENSEKNKMEPRNLAIVFGPTLVRTSENNMTHMVTHMPDQYKIVETLIQQYDWFFGDDGDEEPETVVQTDSAIETQPVPNIDHLLTNIGRTSTPPGEVSDSPPTDSAKSKSSLGSWKDQYSHELVSSIFAAANRKQRKAREKLQASSSEDDLDSVFSEKELQNLKEKVVPGDTTKLREKHDAEESLKTFKNRKEFRNSIFRKLPVKPPDWQKGSRIADLSKVSKSDPPSQVDDQTSDLGTMSSSTSGPRNRSRICDPSAFSVFDLPQSGPVGGSATAEVSSITSDYSTTSFMTFLTGAESSAISSDIQSRGGDEADDECSELISEGRHLETDSETEFGDFTQGGASPVPTWKIPGKSKSTSAWDLLKNRRLLPRLIDHDMSKKQSLQQKTDSESSLEVRPGKERDRMSRSEPSRLSRVLEAVKKGRSTGSLNSTPPQSETVKRPSIAERLRSHLHRSADDMFGISSRKNSTKREKRVRRRHTLGGQRDFKELAVINDWREQGGTEKKAELSDVDQLSPQNLREVSICDGITHELCHAASLKGSKVTEKDLSRISIAPSNQSSMNQLNGGKPKCKGKANLNLGTESHPHKLTGTQVVRSQFYQCL
ncbi:rho GTPase-activating protein 21 [Trichomycterus rosablanca]|uniref:rho GTPase-activating protein 21 n=1 Tax=Trichomycterus rosablanca TaxID=2290929 RepID=UPI002F3548D0